MVKAIEIHDLCKSYRGVQVVQGVSFSVEPGEIFGIVGPNGAGKTTTMEIMEGLRKRDGGQVSVLGLDPKVNGQELRQRVGIQFQSTSIQEKLRVKEALSLFSSFYRKVGNVDQLVQSLGLTPYMNVYFKDLSGGWKQRVTLALAALHDPEILFLDEPSTGLDPHARRDMWRLITQFRDQGVTIILTTHYMEEAEKLCDRVAMFNKGSIVALDTPSRLVTQLSRSKFVMFNSEGCDEKVLEKIPGVQRVQKEHGNIRVYAGDLQEVSRLIFELAKARQWEIVAFRFEQGTLDDLFVNLSEGDGQHQRVAASIDN